jgi:hypothetical protein
MKQLEALEVKIAQVIQNSKDLQHENAELKKLSMQLQEQNEQLQEALMKQSHTSDSLTEEKNALKNSIEELLSSIELLESTK